MVSRTTSTLLAISALITFTALALTYRGNSREDGPHSKALAERIQGEWAFASVTKEELPEVKDLAIRMMIEGDRMITRKGDRVGAVATFTIDEGAAPVAIDMKRDEGGDDAPPGKGILRLGKDRLTMCFAIGEGERPKEFKSGVGRVLMVLERRKK